jgi:EAL domain-containing protein (putative c-di-GMP-specific phosphodiesterase class I)
VRVVNADLDAGLHAELLAKAVTSPTLANLAARRRHHRLLESINAREGVTVGFQPVIDLASNRPMGFEALLRVRAGGKDVAPADVLAAAEDAGRLVEIDAVARSVAVAAAVPTLGTRLLFLNVLPASLPIPSEQLVPLAAEVVAHGMEPGHVVLEAPVGPAGTLRRQLEAVFRVARDVGFKVGLDNVRSDRDLDAIDLRPDVVKADRSLVRGLPSANGTRVIANLVRDCMHSSSMFVAQGIETQEQLQAVRDLGVTVAQGWALGRPGALVPEEVQTAR